MARGTIKTRTVGLTVRVGDTGVDRICSLERMGGELQTLSRLFCVASGALADTDAYAAMRMVSFLTDQLAGIAQECAELRDRLAQDAVV